MRRCVLRRGHDISCPYGASRRRFASLRNASRIKTFDRRSSVVDRSYRRRCRWRLPAWGALLRAALLGNEALERCIVVDQPHSVVPAQVVAPLEVPVLQRQQRAAPVKVVALLRRDAPPAVLRGQRGEIHEVAARRRQQRAAAGVEDRLGDRRALAAVLARGAQVEPPEQPRRPPPGTIYSTCCPPAR